mmetsp:Transcript_22596/g.10888  ORF Transcript_22596/g.10888 Transcript_22596/m.10888 type:complete len:427 (+) Transcript_22596:1166-2446(+)
MNVLSILRVRGFIEKLTHDKAVEDYIINKDFITCYIGFDPTASSFHVGNLLPIMSLAHMQHNGHRPIALIGGGTGLIGDPSGKTEMRKLLAREKAEENVSSLKNQLSRFIDFTDGKALLLNNADWLVGLEYITFLRDIGRHFSVNRMIKTESYRTRINSEEGLNFIEFNYMLLQSYDFIKLYENFGCSIQMGGSDQWGNIVAGIELIRRKLQKTVFGITFPLITTSSGAKMGKTEKGAVWLDAKKTSPYEYYQFWINTEDRDVFRFMALFTFLPIAEIEAIKSIEGAELNSAKAVLAYEATALAHGEDEAKKAFHASASIFGKKIIPESFFPSSNIPRETIGMDDSVPCLFMEKKNFEKGIPAFRLFNMVGLTKSGSETKRLIKQGGAYINGKRLNSIDHMIVVDDFDNGEILLRVGKKLYHKIKL